MKDKRLAILLPVGRVGELEQNRTGRIRWAPDASWERDGQAPRLGLDFLRRLGPRAHPCELPCWFENLLPERDSQLRARLTAAFGLREGQSFDLLRAVGHDLIGAVEAHPAESALPSSIDGAEAEEGENEVAEGLFRMSALTGAQLKFSMSMVNDRLVVAARGRKSLWIVKIPGRDYPELAAVEAATMRWARLAGFEVPETWEVAFERLEGIPDGWIEGREPALAVRRFDRRDDGSKIHQEDLCQALDLRPANKYGDGKPKVTFEGALRLVTDACGDSDGREMARRIGFMIASGNSDAHLKNWSLIWGDRVRPTLSPCYDLVATVSWPRLGWHVGKGPELALRLGGRPLFRDLDETVLETFAKGSYDWASEEVRTGIRRARDVWRDVAPDAPERMRTAIAEHWREVALLARMGPL